MKNLDDLENGELKIEQFPAHLAVKGNVSPFNPEESGNLKIGKQRTEDF